MRMRSIISLSVASPALPHFPTLSHKRYNFRKKRSNCTKMCVFLFSLQLLSETFLILRRIQLHIINVFKYSTRYSCQSLMKLDFSRRLLFNYQFYWKSVQWEPSCYMRSDWRTDSHDEAGSRFSQFCERAYDRRHNCLLQVNMITASCFGLIC
jgi:hypothetical protein